jgi:UDP-N-acetyl-D-glucosamine dehydrogenase
MPRYVVSRIQDALNDRGLALRGARLLVLGVAYKPNVADTRESPALDVIGLLREKGADVEYFDPCVSAIQHEGWGMRSVPDAVAVAARADCVVLVTDHANLDYTGVVQAARLVFDTRNAFRSAGISDPKVVRL